MKKQFFGASLPKDYGSLQQAQRSLLEVEAESDRYVTVESLKRATRNAYKDMKLTNKDPKEARFLLKVQGNLQQVWQTRSQEYRLLEQERRRK